MDATASILNIIQITGVLIDYLRAATQAPSERRKLLLEANTLCALLTSLKDFLILEDRDGFPDWRRAVYQLSTPDGPLEQYRDELVNLLRKIDPKSKLQKAVQTILWKMTKEDVQDMMLRIERTKSIISIALEMDHVRLSEAIYNHVSNIAVTTELIRSDTLRLASSVDEAAFQSLLDRICPDDYSGVYRSNITEHTAGIGQNFIASSEFNDWATTDAAPRTLLCVGDPGVGKTVMATKAIETLRSKDVVLREAVIFVYCDCTRRRSRLNRRDSSPEAKSKGVQTPRHLIASLLRQIAESYGSPTPYLSDLMTEHERQKARPMVQELEQAFAEVASHFDKVYVIVDAMDECDSLEMETFAQHLLSVCSTSSLRLLVTSRRHPQIEQIFENSARLDMKAYDNDTLQYLQSRAKREFPPRVLRDGRALDKILNALLASANGIPLIARLHMNALRGVRTPGGMLATISRLKSNSDVYDETYQAAMERIMKQPGELPSMAMKVLRWVVCAKRYLYTRELQCVLAMQDDSDSFDEDFVPDMDDVFLACEGLVCTITSPNTDTVRLELVHTTARQYFDRKLAEWAPDVGLDLTRTCLSVLSFEDLTPLPRSLVAYAWRYWGSHAKDVEELDEHEQFSALVSLLRKFLTSEGGGSPLSRAVRIREERDYPVAALQEGLTGYHLAAKFGLVRLFEALWDPADDLDSMLGTHGYDRTPLLQAVFSESIEMVKLMLKLQRVSSNRRSKGGVTPLEVAIIYPDIVKVLLEEGGADPNETESNGSPLVLQAAALGQKRSLELLLDATAMDQGVRHEYGPALLEFASFNDVDKLKLPTYSLEEMKKYVDATHINGVT